MQLSMDAIDVVLVLTTVPDDDRAGVWATLLVEERLAACVNIYPAMTSFYRWHGMVERGVERQLVIKTTRGQVEALRTRLHALHSYELPEFVVLDVDEVGERYGRWVREETQLAEKKK